MTKQANHANLLDDTKWSANISYDTCLKIAQSLNFELNRFLVST